MILVKRLIISFFSFALVWLYPAGSEEQQTGLQLEFCITQQLEGSACVEALAREQIRNERRLDALRLKCDDSRGQQLETTTQMLAQCEAELGRVPALEAEIQTLKAALEAEQTKNSSLTGLAERYENISKELNTARFEIRGLDEQVSELNEENARLRQQIINMEEEIKLTVDADKLRTVMEGATCNNANVAEILASEGAATIVSPSRLSAQNLSKKLGEAAVDLTNLRLGFVNQPEGADCPYELQMGLVSLRWKGEPPNTRASLFSRGNAEPLVAALPFDQGCADLSASEEFSSGEVWVVDEQDKLHLCDLSSGDTRLSRKKDDIGFLFLELEFLENE